MMCTEDDMRAPPDYKVGDTVVWREEDFEPPTGKSNAVIIMAATAYGAKKPMVVSDLWARPDGRWVARFDEMKSGNGTSLQAYACRLMPAAQAGMDIGRALRDSAAIPGKDKNYSHDSVDDLRAGVAKLWDRNGGMFT